MVNFIQGGKAADVRGNIRFVNAFDMSLVKRFYIIQNADTELIRGWRAHRIEQRWFYVVAGSFSVDMVKIDNWEQPSPELEIHREIIEESNHRLLHLPAGYGTAFRALEPDSQLLVFADYGIEHASKDDYTYPIAYFSNY